MLYLATEFPRCGSQCFFWHRGSYFPIEEFVAGGEVKSRFVRFHSSGARLPTLLILHVVDQWQLSGFVFAVGNRLHVSIPASCISRHGAVCVKLMDDGTNRPWAGRREVVAVFKWGAC